VENGCEAPTLTFHRNSKVPHGKAGSPPSTALLGGSPAACPPSAPGRGAPRCHPSQPVPHSSSPERQEACSLAPGPRRDCRRPSLFGRGPQRGPLARQVPAQPFRTETAVCKAWGGSGHDLSGDPASFRADASSSTLQHAQWLPWTCCWLPFPLPIPADHMTDPVDSSREGEGRSGQVAVPVCRKPSALCRLEAAHSQVCPDARACLAAPAAPCSALGIPLTCGQGAALPDQARQDAAGWIPKPKHTGSS